ncbi:MAG: hypothetical protein RL591_1961, partial [Planctomycetota bacterium]
MMGQVVGQSSRSRVQGARQRVVTARIVSRGWRWDGA